jgi:hypothetical protein
MSSATLQLQALNQKRIAVLMHPTLDAHVLRGTGVFEQHELLGNVLRICIDNPSDEAANGTFDVLIQEREWTGRILPDTTYGCDFIVDLRKSP